MQSAALMSGDHLYRYTLMREWEEGGTSVLWIMLNPSTADAANDDPTLRACIEFSKRRGASRLEVVNLFALRSPYPGVLNVAQDPVGPLNDQTIGLVLDQDHTTIVAAWGGKVPPMLAQRVHDVKMMVHERGRSLCTLGLNKDGSPKHPLYVKRDTPIRVWSPS